MLSCAWHPLINMLANQEAGLTQQALNKNHQRRLVSTSWTWNLGRYIYDTDWFSRHISTLKTRAEMVLEMLVFLPFNQLTWLVAREHFIIQSRHESYKSYKCTISFEFQVMRNLLCTHMGHSALYTMCKILQDPAAARDVRLLRGAVFHVNMGLWSTKKVGTLKCTPTSVLPSFLCVSKS
jgi:hypothetical protein